MFRPVSAAVVPLPSVTRRYGVAALAVLAADGLVFLMRPLIGPDLFFPPFTLAVLGAAVYGGLGAGLAATAAVAVLNAVFVARSGADALTAANSARLLLFVASGLGVTLLAQARSRALAAHARQRQWLQVTMASMGDAVVVTDDIGRITFMNTVAEAVAGARSAQCEGRRFEEAIVLVNETTRAPVNDIVSRVLATGVTIGLGNHTLLVRPDGAEIPIDDSAAAVRGTDGRILGVVLVFRDVSDRRRAEAEKARLYDDARRANRLKDEFLTTLSHELRTPLNAILGWSHTLLHHETGPDTRRGALEAISRNANAQLRLVEDLLDVSRIVTGKMHMDVRPVRLAVVLREALDVVRPAAEARGVHLEGHFECEPLLMGDAPRLQQVFWNLLSNAVRFTPKGGRVQAVLALRGSAVEVRVTDTGAGIAPEFLPHVFERFRQADSSSRRERGGLGLGLAIVRHLVELHGGSVVAESDGENLGAAFIVTLPVPAIQHHDDSPPEGIVTAPSLAGIRVLLVDDEGDAREIVGGELARLGARVTAAASVDAALAELEREAPDVILSDLGMPGKDGYDLLAAVRRRPPSEGGTTPAIALTAYGRKEDEARALAAGYQVHLAKPAPVEELARVIATLASQTAL